MSSADQVSSFRLNDKYSYPSDVWLIGIGDVRSRLVRLIPDTGVETQAIRKLFNHRLPKDYASARSEWLDIVEATHSLWQGVSLPKQELIRSFLNVINLEVVKRLRPTSRFDWSGASIGNLFLTGWVLLCKLGGCAGQIC